MKSIESANPTLLATILTPSGRAAVATIGLCGDLQKIDVAFHPRNRRSASAQVLNRIVFGLWSLEGPEATNTEEVVYCRISDDLAELHCHGGAAAISRVLADLEASGAHVITAAEFAAHTTDAVEADVELTLSRATTARTAQLLLKQRDLFPTAIAALRQQNTTERRQHIDEMLAWWRFGEHLTVPWRVVLCGEPNVGKSTLMNALVGYQRAIVFDQPGTTRDVLTAETALAGWPVQFLDTAGLRETSEFLEAEGIQKARERVQTADLVLIMHDATAPERSGQLARDVAQLNPQVLHIWNKIDRCSEPPAPQDNVLTISALQNVGLEELQQVIVNRLIPQTPPDDLPVPCSEWQRTLLVDLRT